MLVTMFRTWPSVRLSCAAAWMVMREEVSDRHATINEKIHFFINVSFGEETRK